MVELVCRRCLRTVKKLTEHGAGSNTVEIDDYIEEVYYLFCNSSLLYEITKSAIENKKVATKDRLTPRATLCIIKIYE